MADEVITPPADPTKPPDTPPGAPPVAGLTAEQVAEIAGRTAKSVISELRSESPVSSQQPVAEPAPPRAVPASELAEAMKEANETGDFRKYTQLLEARDQHTAYQVEQRLNPIRSVGAQSITDTSFALAKSDSEMPHFTRYQKEVKDFLNQTVPPGTPITKQLLEGAYAMIVGKHANELLAETEEKAVRRGREESPAAMPGAPGRQVAQKQTESFAEAFGGDTARVLETKLSTKGYDRDTWARRQGYESFDKLLETQRELDSTGPTLGLDR